MRGTPPTVVLALGMLGTLGLVPAAVAAPPPTPMQGLRFTEEALRVGLHHPAKRAVWTDLDGDTWLDAVLDRRRVYWNRPANGREAGVGGRRFVPAPLEEVWSPAPPEAESGFTLFEDVDGDGDTDAFWAVYLDLERPLVQDGEVQMGPAGRPLPAMEDPGHRSTLYLNDGTGRLVAFPESGLASPPMTATAGTFLDYDGDGHLDLFVGAWYREYGLSYRAYSDRLYRGLGGGRFEDVTDASGIRTRDTVGDPDSGRPTYGATACDWDGDGDDDLLVATYGRQANVLWRNNGDGTFTDVAPATGFDGDDRREGRYPCIDRDPEEPFRSHGNTFDIGCADFDSDGDMDVLLGEITHWWAGPDSDLTSLLVNQGPAEEHRFRRRNRDIGLVRPVHDLWRWNQGDIHVGWLDADNDSALDLFIGSGDYPDGQFLRLWRQEGPRRFVESTRTAGLRWEGSGGVSAGDFDRDGDADLLVGRSLFRLSRARRQELGPEAGLWVNRQGQNASWIGFLFHGTPAQDRPASTSLGAQLEVRACGSRRSRQHRSARGHAGHADAPEVLFGLGRCRRPVDLRVLWPGAPDRPDVHRRLRPGRWYRLSEGRDPEPLDLGR